MLKGMEDMDSCRKDAFYGAHQKDLNEGRPTISAVSAHISLVRLAHVNFFRGNCYF